LNAGLRFDQMYQYVDANQLSPRVSLTWKPYDGTTFHAGYARNFTPPQQVIAAPTNLALVTAPTAPANTQTPEVPINSPVLPERSHVFDVGVVQKIYPVPGLEVGIDGYDKTARDLLDDGQFGAAYVLNGFNYDRGENIGLEFKASHSNGTAPGETLPGQSRSPPPSYRTSFCSLRTKSTISPRTVSIPTTPRS
jgi:outer membrane receptor protein involved in Fe transport